MKLEEYEKGLVWDNKDHFIQQSWYELKQKIKNTHGGIGIIAADFDELLRYGYGLNPWHRREHFSKLVADARDTEDIELLSEILAIMLIRPWEANLQGGWFIYYLKKADKFDAERASLVLNELYNINIFAATVLIQTLNQYVIFEGNNTIYIYDLLRKAGLLRKELLNIMNPINIFISYAKEDSVLVEKIYNELETAGFKVWKDTHELLPGENWELEIKKNLSNCNFVVLCLSQLSVSKIGYFQEEIKTVLKLQRRRPSGKVFCIPVILNKFDLDLLPLEIMDLQYIDICEDWNKGIEKIKKSILLNI